MNTIKYPLFALSILIFAACGGGGGSPATTSVAIAKSTATLKLATSGSPSAQLAGIGITITLPDGVTPALNSDGSVAATVAAASGVAVPGTILAPVYTQASGSVKGTLSLAMASSIAAGFGAGEFVTINLEVTGAWPTQSDFSLSGFNPIDLKGNSATGITAAVASLSEQ